MVTCPRLVFLLCTLPLIVVGACSDPIELGSEPGTGGGDAGTGGTGGSHDAGVGGMGGLGGMDGGDAGTNCVETGCDDGNDCTTDGICNTVMGICVGGGVDEPADTPCSQDGGFFCDGEGSCVVCNGDDQCSRFFPDRECREAASCVDRTCPIPAPLPDGTPCTAGACYQGTCVDVLPQRKLVPMVCDNQVTPFFWPIPMDMMVSPTAIEATRPFDADIRAALSIPQAFLQFGLISVFPDQLSSLEITRAGAEIVASDTLSGSPISARLAPTPLTLPIPRSPNPGDPGGDSCTTDAECPLAEFGQRCGAGGQCECACQMGCIPEACANVATGDVVVTLNPIFNAPYRAEASGAVCFDVGGADPPSAVGAPPVRTGIRAVASNGALVRFECVGGTVNDAGTPDNPFDDFVDPNPPQARICFPVEVPEVDLCAGPPPVDCNNENACVVDAVCDPFTGECAAGDDQPRGMPCDQDGGNACDGQGSCVQCVEDAGCVDDGNQCTTGPDCEDDRCLIPTNLPEGTVCEQNGGNRCDGNGNCVLVGDGPLPKTEAITLGCTSNLTPDVSIVPFELTVAPAQVTPGAPFVADLSGVGVVPEPLLDSVQWVIVGGTTRIDLVDFKATVHVRAGASGNDVTLTPEAIPYRCAIGDAVCDPANDLPSVPGRRGNDDCTPIGLTNPCGRFIDIPTSDECEPGGSCALLDAGSGTKLDQCETNGFCVTGEIRLPLEPQVQTYTAGNAGSVLFGWDDASTGAGTNADRTWALPPAVFDAPIASNGIRTSIDGLSVALECTMGVDSGGIYGVGAPERSSATPNLLLISFPIQP